MGLLSGQAQTMLNGDVIAIKHLMFEKLYNDVYKVLRNTSYNKYEVNSLVRNILESVHIYDLYNVFALKVNDIEKLCKSAYVLYVKEQSCIFAEQNIVLYQTLENALRFYRGEFDYLPIQIHDNVLFADTINSVYYTTTLSKYLNRHSIMASITKAFTGSHVEFAKEFIEEAKVYVHNKMFNV